MARVVTLSNGNLSIGISKNGEVGDVYFPYVGQENHTLHQLRHKIGIFIDGKFSWLDDENTWSFKSRFFPETMVSEFWAESQALGVKLEIIDCIDAKSNNFIRNVQTINLFDVERDFKLFMHQSFKISGIDSADTAQYRPDKKAIMHYKGERFFMVGGQHSDGRSFDEFSIGKYDLGQVHGTFRDAEDGKLEGNQVENGNVDSVVGFYERIPAFDSVRINYWLSAGKSLEEIDNEFNQIAKHGVDYLIDRTAIHWRNWSKNSQKVVNLLPKEYVNAFYDSLFTLKAHIGSSGEIVASLDGGLANHPQDDTYNFCWGRDASYILWPLVRLGYYEELKNFLDFCTQTIDKRGFLHHKYKPDRSLGSTWLAWQKTEFGFMPPIQSDETASVLFLIGNYYRQTQDRQILVRYYTSLIEPMANFLLNFTDKNGLPLPSFDLWEHSYLTHTYTTAVTHAALVEASEMAEVHGRNDDSVKWQTAASVMKDSASLFFNKDKKYFYRGISENERDDTIDLASLFGVFMYSFLDMNSPEFVLAKKTAFFELRSKLHRQGFLRFENDDYMAKNSENPNPWIISSLWIAQIMIEEDNINGAREIIDWVLGCSLGPALPEQVSPESLEATSVVPLAWSHAELLNTLIDMIQPPARQKESY